MMRTTAGLFVAVAVLVGACGAEETTVEGGRLGEEESERPASAAYEVTLGNAITDTLRGDANFGYIYDPRTQSTQFVIRLESDYDFAGGVVIARKATGLPGEGTYEVSMPADSLPVLPADEFIITYREGILRDLYADSGTLTLSNVTDSLITGHFDVTLRGEIAALGGELEEGSVHAVGEFRADQGISGYIIGL